MNYWFYCFINTRQIISLQEAQCIHVTKEQVVVLYPAPKRATEEKPFAILTILADLNNTFDNCGVRERKAV